MKPLTALGSFFECLQEYLGDAWNERYNYDGLADTKLRDVPLAQALCGVGRSSYTKARRCDEGERRSAMRRVVAWVVLAGCGLEPGCDVDDVPADAPLTVCRDGRLMLRGDVGDSKVAALVNRGLERCWLRARQERDPVYELITEVCHVAGDDPFSEAVYGIYAAEYGDVPTAGEPVGLDMRRAVRAATWVAPSPAEPPTRIGEPELSGTVLRCLLLGVLCGPAGLRSVHNEVGTPFVEGHACDGTAEVRLRKYAEGKGAVGFEIAGCEGGTARFLFEAMPPVVSVGRSYASDVNVGQCVGSTVSRDHCSLRHDGAGGVVLRGNYPSNATRVCHVSGGGEVLLEGDDEEQLLDGDQIFLPGRGDPVSVLTVTYLW